MAEREISNGKNLISKHSWSPPFAVVILGQNCVRLSDAALYDYFFSFFESLCYKKQGEYDMKIRLAQIIAALL